VSVAAWSYWSGAIIYGAIVYRCVLLLVGHDIGQVILHMHTGHVQQWNMLHLEKYWVGDFKVL